jgi:hypothetical protein
VPKICYEEVTLSAENTAFVKVLDGICYEYAQQGYELTLRQLYYQCVARGIIANNTKEYDKLGRLLVQARMGGLIDWYHIVDRTRNLYGNTHWERPSDLIQGAAKQYAVDKWENQKHYVEVHIEKQALEGVIARKCGELDVGYFSCRGYTSVSEMWSTGQRLLHQIEKDKEVHIIHLGDHDPSGLDMSGDLKRRLDTFVGAHCGERVHVLRVALNMAQVERLNPPPNPAKITDPRAGEYIRQYGEYSWELDAISPTELNEIVERAVLRYRDETLWAQAVELEKKGRRTLEAIYTEFPKVVSFLRGELA